MKTSKDRLLKFLTYLDIGQNAFEKKVGISNGYVSHNKGSFGSSIISKISKTYPELNTVWLLTGKGEMLTNEQYAPNPIAVPDNDGIPLIPIEAVAGFQSGDSEGVTVEQCERYKVPEFSQRGVDFLTRVSGSSMYPKYNNGDILACKKIPQLTFIQWGKIYVLDTVQGALVKRLYKDPEDKECVICKSDNVERYPEFSIHVSEIRSISIVIGVIRIE